MCFASQKIFHYKINTQLKVVTTLQGGWNIVLGSCCGFTCSSSSSWLSWLYATNTSGCEYNWSNRYSIDFLFVMFFWLSRNDRLGCSKYQNHPSDPGNYNTKNCDPCSKGNSTSWCLRTVTRTAFRGSVMSGTSVIHLLYMLEESLEVSRFTDRVE